MYKPTRRTVHVFKVVDTLNPFLLLTRKRLLALATDLIVCEFGSSKKRTGRKLCINSQIHRSFNITNTQIGFSSAKKRIIHFNHVNPLQTTKNASETQPLDGFYQITSKRPSTRITNINTGPRKDTGQFVAV